MNSPGAHPADAAFRILGKGIDQKSPPPLTTCSGSISGARRAGLRAGYRRPRRRLRRVVTHLLAQECRTEMPDSGIHFADGRSRTGCWIDGDFTTGIDNTMR